MISDCLVLSYCRKWRHILVKPIVVDHITMNLYSKYMEIAPSFLYGLLCFSAILVWTLVAILTLPLWLLFRVFKWSQGVIISYYRLGRILASNDVPFLHETEINRNYINGLFVLEGVIGLDDLRKLILSRVVQNSEEPSYACVRSSKKLGLVLTLRTTPSVLNSLFKLQHIFVLLFHFSWPVVFTSMYRTFIQYSLDLIMTTKNVKTLSYVFSTFSKFLTENIFVKSFFAIVL